MFTVPKKDSENKGFFFNLKELNKFIANYHFKMVVFEAALKFVKQNVMMASVGLRDRYIVRIHEEDRKCLRFICKKKVLWENLFTNENFLCSKNIYDTLWNPSLYFASYWFLEYFIYWWFPFDWWFKEWIYFKSGKASTFNEQSYIINLKNIVLKSCLLYFLVISSMILPYCEFTYKKERCTKETCSNMNEKESIYVRSLG